MKKALLLTGVLLFVLGAALVLGSYFLFNKYSLSDSRDFGAVFYSANWEFPDNPLELGEGDIVAAQISINIDRDLQFRIENTGGTVVFTKSGQNFTAYYYVQTHDLYIMNLRLGSGSVAPCRVSYFLEVTRKAPNQFLLLVGIIVLLAGAVTVPIAFLNKDKKIL
jgi:hypothetical protein